MTHIIQKMGLGIWAYTTLKRGRKLFMREFLVYYSDEDKNFKKAFKQFVKERDYENVFKIQ